MNKIILFFFPLFIFGCANKVPPQGGDKDTTPPVLVSSLPEMYSTQFKGREFTLEFDELFDLDNVYRQLIVSPPILSKPKIKTNRNKLTVSFYEENLIPNTTYNFNFGDAIKDHNEGNILKNFSYVFSTGDFIDSLKVSGKIVDAFTKKPLENIAVMLYDSPEDSLPLTTSPNYVDKTDENGDYIISNIKAGSYKIFALEDLNQNYIYDQPSERIGFVFDLLALEPDSIFTYNIPLFQEDNKQQFVKTITATPYGFVTIIMNKPFEKLNFRVLNRDPNHKDFKHKLWPGGDTLQFWFPDYEEEFILEISDVEEFTDSIDVKIEPVFSLKDEIGFIIKSNVKEKMDLGANLTINLQHPIRLWNPKVIKLWEDSVEVNISPYFIDSIKTAIRINYPWKEKSKYDLLIGLGAFTDMYEQKNDVYEIKFGAQEESYYGEINLQVNLFKKEWPYLLELLDGQMKIIKTNRIHESSKIVYPRLIPGAYRFRIIEDVNENGKWDPGNYELGILPEAIYYFAEEVKVRSNWELDQTWNVLIE